MSVTAIIVARGGSVRLPGKALLPFAGSTLLGHKVRTLKACPTVSRVVVGSDSEAILAEARRCGAEAIRRDDYHCDESRCSANDMIRDMAAKVGGDDGDIIVWAHPTNPLVKSETFTRAIDTFGAMEAAGYDSLLSVTPIQRHAWVDGKPLNYDPWATRHTLAKDLKPVLFQDGAIFIQRRRNMLANGYFFGIRPWLFTMPTIESTDIDTREDYDVACLMLHKEQ